MGVFCAVIVFISWRFGLFWLCSYGGICRVAGMWCRHGLDIYTKFAILPTPHIFCDISSSQTLWPVCLQSTELQAPAFAMSYNYVWVNRCRDPCIERLSHRQDSQTGLGLRH